MKIQTKAVSRVEEIQDQIADLNSAIAEQEAEIQEFETSLTMLQNHEGWRPAENSSTFEMLRSIITSESEESQRKNRIAQSSVALEESRRALQAKRISLEQLESELAQEQQEQQWQALYAPFVEQFESGFKMPVDPNSVKIDQLEWQLIDDRAALEKARAWLAIPSNQVKPRYSLSPGCINPQKDYDVLAAKIPILEEKLQKLKELPPLARSEEEFRRYIVGRVMIEESLQRLITAQAEYAEALQKFKTAATGQESALDFPLKELTELPQTVAIANNQIILIKGAKNG